MKEEKKPQNHITSSTITTYSKILNFIKKKQQWERIRKKIFGHAIIVIDGKQMCYVKYVALKTYVVMKI